MMMAVTEVRRDTRRGFGNSNYYFAHRACPHFNNWRHGIGHGLDAASNLGSINTVNVGAT